MFQRHVPKVTSDFREEIQHLGVLRFATTTSGVQFVMTCGMMWMLKWPADNLVSVLKVRTTSLFFIYAWLTGQFNDIKNQSHLS